MPRTMASLDRVLEHDRGEHGGGRSPARSSTWTDPPAGFAPGRRALPWSVSRVLLALAGAAVTWTGTVAAPDEPLGTYRMQGQGRVDARPFPSQQAELHADAVLTEGDADGEVLLRLAGEGLTCELAGTLRPGGLLTLDQGQRCATDLRSDALAGRVEARLVTGAGRLRGDALDLELTFTVSGAVRLKGGGLLDLLARRLALGGDPVPVRGEGQAQATGWRDRSQAAAR